MRQRRPSDDRQTLEPVSALACDRAARSPIHDLRGFSYGATKCEWQDPQTPLEAALHAHHSIDATRHLAGACLLIKMLATQEQTSQRTDVATEH
jgi:hypothetical protein